MGSVSEQGSRLVYCAPRALSAQAASQGCSRLLPGPAQGGQPRGQEELPELGAEWVPAPGGRPSGVRAAVQTWGHIRFSVPAALPACISGARAPALAHSFRVCLCFG